MKTFPVRSAWQHVISVLLPRPVTLHLRRRISTSLSAIEGLNQLPGKSSLCPKGNLISPTKVVPGTRDGDKCVLRRGLGHCNHPINLARACLTAAWAPQISSFISKPTTGVLRTSLGNTLKEERTQNPGVVLQAR